MGWTEVEGRQMANGKLGFLEEKESEQRSGGCWRQVRTEKGAAMPAAAADEEEGAGRMNE
jgi:hypothetical protein